MWKSGQLRHDYRARAINGIRIGLVLIFAMAVPDSASLAAGACLTRQQCIESHAGYCRHHAGCWHTGQAQRGASAPRPKRRSFDPDPYGDPAWRDVETNPHGDPVWWTAAPK